ncbi:MAG: monovalent cation/H+ antiporter subunit D family protein [Nitrospinota bacterium]
MSADICRLLFMPSFWSDGFCSVTNSRQSSKPIVESDIAIMTALFAYAQPAHLLINSLAGVAMINAFSTRPNVREFWTFLAAGVNFLIVLSMLPKVLSSEVLIFQLLTVVPGLSIVFRVDALSMFLGLTASSLWIVNSLYSVGYMRAHNEHSQTRFFSAFALAIGATMGVAFSGSLFTLFIFYEILTVVTYPLVVHHQNAEARAGARRYIVYLLGCSTAFFLTAVILTYSVSGTLEFKPEGILSGAASHQYILLLFFLFILGIAKSGIMPVHSWLPAAMVAPTPVSALLHAVAVVKVGVFSVVKILLYVFGVELLKETGINNILTFMAAFTIITASLVALCQDNLKRRLAFSTVSQLSYILMSISLLSVAGIKSALVHILFHAYGKITLFFAAGSIYIASHKTKISQLGGIGWKMPWTMGAFFIGSLSMIGVPPAAGFISKWYLIKGSLQAGEWMAIGVVIVSSLLNAAYFLPIVYVAFFKEESKNGTEHGTPGESPWPMVVALVVTATGTLGFFFFPDIPVELSELVVKNLFEG